MEKGLTVPKWVLIVRKKILTPNAPKMFGPICLPRPKSLVFKKNLSLGVRSLCTKSLLKDHLIKNLAALSKNTARWTKLCSWTKNVE